MLTGLLKILLLLVVVKTGQVTSKTIFLFWLLNLGIYIVNIVSETNSEDTNAYKLTVQSCNLSLCAILLILQWFTIDDEHSGSKTEQNVSFISVLLFSWLDHLFIKGFTNKIEYNDIPELPHCLNVQDIILKFEHFYKAQLNGIRKLLVPLIKSFGSKLLIGSVLRAMNDVLLFLSPLILRKILNVMESQATANSVGYFWCGMLLITSVGQSVVSAQYFRTMFQAGFQMRTVVMSTIFKKSLKLSPAARQQYSAGEITNLLAIDAQRFVEVIPQINVIWSAPFQIILAVYFLYDIVGASAFAGMAVLFLLVPANVIGNYFGKKIQTNQMNLKDKRVLKLNEILQGIKVIKYYAWEKPFMSIINQIRKSEIKTIKQNAVVYSMLNVTFTIVPLTVTLTTFVVYIYLDPVNHVLTAEKVFSCIAIFNVLRVPLFLFPMFFMETVKFLISMKRISKFLDCSEIDNKYLVEDCNDKIPVQINNASFQWDERSKEKEVLSNINLSASNAELIAVIGKVGSGKSSLLASLMGDMSCRQGNIKISTKSFSYVSQQAWIQNKTVKDNILFGSPENSELYQKVIAACALAPDLVMLQDGDLTEIGENGVNLSGGQKQRIALARAAYRNSDVSGLCSFYTI